MLDPRAYKYGVLSYDSIDTGIMKLIDKIEALEKEKTMPAPTDTTATMRQFTTGATRSPDAGKIDYAGFLSPYALERFGKYMQKHQTQEDGKPRASDNWKKGIPLDSYRRSMVRHMIDFAKAYESEDDEQAQELLCAIWFNVQGYLHERNKPDFSKNDKMTSALMRGIPPGDVHAYNVLKTSPPIRFTEGDRQPKPAPKGMDDYARPSPFSDKPGGGLLG